MAATLRLVLLGWLCLASGTRLSADPARLPPAAMPVEVREARSLLRRQRATEALARLEQAGGPSVDAPERTWVWAHVASLVKGQFAAREAVAALPVSPLRLSLLSLLSEHPDDLRPAVLRAASRSGDAWLWLGAAVLSLRLGEALPALEAAQRAAARGSPFVRLEALQNAARAATELGRLEEASDLAAEAAALVPEDSRPRSVRAEIERKRGRLPEARVALLEALRLDPGSALYARRLAELLREDLEVPPDRALLASIDALALPAGAEADALRGLVAERLGRPVEARAAYERALSAGAHPVPVEHALRVLLAQAGEHADLVRLLEQALPPEVLAAPENLLGGAWAALRTAAAGAPDAKSPPERQETLARALVALGALEEAQVIARRGPRGQDALADRLGRHLALEAALRALVEQGYRDAAHHRVPPDLLAFRRALHDAARRLLPPADAAAFAPEVGGLKSLGPLGAWLDHGALRPAPIVAYFRGYGRYLVLGQRREQPVEAILLALGYLAPAAPLAPRREAHRHDTAIGYHRVVRAWLDAQGGGLAGACLPDGLWLDAEAALDAEHDVRAGLALDPALSEAAAAIPAPPADGRRGPFAMGDPAGLAYRLARRYVATPRGDRWGSFRTLRAHESGHVIDLRRHLPIVRGLPATLALLASVGFASKRMEAVLERRAQLTALLDAPDPALALYEMVALLPAVEREPEVHAAGYRDGLARLVHHVWARPDAYPQIDRTRALLPQLDRLSDDQLRRAAWACVGSE